MLTIHSLNSMERTFGIKNLKPEYVKLKGIMILTER